MGKLHIRAGDRVVLTKAITGAKDTSGRPLGRETKGTVSRVLKVLPEERKVIVEHVNYVYRHVRPSRKNPQGGRIAREAPIDISNVMLYCEKCDRGVRVRIERVPKDVGEGEEGRKKRYDVVRYCKRCGEVIKPAE